MILNKLAQLEQESIHRGIPIIGREKGAWLLQIIKKFKPKKILELGTANGYSGCILGSEGGKLTTIEVDEKIAEEAAINFAKNNINAEILLGNGIDIIRDLVKKKLNFDLIFIDFFKKGYIKVGSNCVSLTKTGGVIIADNISMEDCRDFAAAVLHNPKLKTEVINIGDGLSYSIRK
ncbi:hypothetical protein J4479_01620 [Candidatus Woesearchaeota archaeon]|nr:hypothetical protein [Candidatus Woesearchaeota archaeon]